jgi:hypothetical protein
MNIRDKGQLHGDPSFLQPTGGMFSLGLFKAPSQHFRQIVDHIRGH